MVTLARMGAQSARLVLPEPKTIADDQTRFERSGGMESAGNSFRIAAFNSSAALVGSLASHKTVNKCSVSKRVLALSNFDRSLKCAPLEVNGFMGGFDRSDLLEPVSGQVALCFPGKVISGCRDIRAITSVEAECQKSRD
jgi:hypothetical protein